MGQVDARRFWHSKLPLNSRIKLQNTLLGEWPSVFTGEGIEFAGVRPLEPGDDLRDLDLHTLAQSGEEEIVQRVVGRQRQIHIWADWSGSMQSYPEMLFSAKPQIREIAIGLLLFSAWNAGCPTGFCAFHQEHTLFPAKSGQSHCAEIWTWVASPLHSTSSGPVNVATALDLLLKNASPQSLVFLISDFQDPTFAGDFTPLLLPVARKFDLVPVVIRDPLETGASLRWPVTIAVRNSEGEGSAEIRLTPQVLAQIQAASAAHLSAVEQHFHRLGVDHVVLDSSSMDACYKRLASFFEARVRIRA